MRVLVIGGTLFIGRHLTTALLAAGHEVAILHRSAGSRLPAGVRGILADRNDPGAIARVLAGERFEAVFDNVYDWERGTTAEQVMATAQAANSGALERYVFMSSVAAFGDGLDHHDGDPLALDDHPEAYVRNKAKSERALLAAQDIPAVTLRPPFVYGPDNPFYREAFFWDRLRDGRPILVPDDGSRIMQFVHVDDIVAACLKALETPEAIGKGINLGDGPGVTQLEAVQAFARAAGREANVVFVPREKALAAGGHPMGPKYYFAQYYDLPPITMRLDRLHDLLKVRPTPFDEGLRQTYEWWLEAKPFGSPDYELEDSLLR